MLKNRIRTLLGRHAGMLPDVTDLYGKAGLEWLRTLTLREVDGRLFRDDLDLPGRHLARESSWDRTVFLGGEPAFGLQLLNAG